MRDSTTRPRAGSPTQSPRSEVRDGVRRAIAGTSLRVGLNYPWGTRPGVASYGWDFGDPYGLEAPWEHRLAADLEALVALGVDVVRWFVLADGRVLGRVGAELRETAPGRWTFDPPALSVDDRAVAAFRQAVRAFGAPAVRGRIRLVPVLVDGVELPRASRVRRKYRPHGPGGRVLAGGRADAVGRSRGAFFARCLAPFVEVCREHADLLEAVELINEPEMLAASGVPRRDRVAFVREGVAFLRDRLEDAIPVTVGYQYLDGLLDPELGARAAGVTLAQFHWYGSRAPLRFGALPTAPRVGDLGPAVLGEVPVRFGPWPPKLWPALEWRFRRGLASRLALAEARGYESVWLWSGQRGRRDPFSRFWV